MFCPKCGNQLNQDDAFCGSCGAPVADRADALQKAMPQPEAPAAQPPAQAPKKRVGAGMVALAAVLLCGLVAIGATIAVLHGDDADESTATTSQTAGQTSTATAADGQEVVSMERPVLISFTQESDAASVVPSVEPYAVEDGLTNVVNADRFYLTDEEQDLVVQNGFAVSVGLAGYEFFDSYEMNRYSQTPNFVTVDSMMHTYHLYFSYLMKNTERDYLAPALGEVSRAMLDESLEQLAAAEGTGWEDAALRNVAFFAVGASLLDPSTEVPSQVEDVVSAELAQIEDAAGIAESPLMGAGNMEDYSQYVVRGYYEGDEQLESYFKAMMWYGRMNFAQKNEDLDRSACLMALALQESGALADWEGIYTVTSFFAGASDDCGFYEYYPILESVYGKTPSIDDLVENEDAWAEVHTLTADMPAPQINSIATGRDDDADYEEENKGYRFMGQRFTLDAAIFQKLVYNEVLANDAGEDRMLPCALDVPAALGSDEALEILEEQGETGYENYSENMTALREGLGSADDDTLWSASLYSQWLYTLDPLLDVKGEGYPSFMANDQWTRKNLQSYLGSYSELKHDTILYSKQVMAEMGGGEEPDVDDRGYVEPEPMVFERLQKLTDATAEGLDRYGMLSAEDAENLEKLSSLAGQLETIAIKELQGELPTDEEFELIRSYGGQLEHFWQTVYEGEAEGENFTAREFPAALVADIATDAQSGTCLEVGVGDLSEVFVVVPIDGELHLTSGVVFSYYEFEQPIAERLTDSEWRKMMGIDIGDDGNFAKPAQDIEEWTRGFQVERPR